MTADEFIFSEKRKIKLARHLAFWSIYCFVSFYAEIQPTSINSFSQFSLYGSSLLSLAFFLPINILSAYAFIYFLMPIFIMPKKYLAFIMSAFLVLSVSFAIDYFLSRLFLQLTYSGMDYSNLYGGAPPQIAYAEAVHSGLAVCACAIGIKLAKNGYLQQMENTKLAKREADSKTKLMKSNIQPEFLFRSLHNLYKKINKSPEEAPEIALHLSEILSYTLYDTTDEKTPLSKELFAVKRLITIEKLLGNNLEISIDIPGDSSDKYITPLLLFSIFLRMCIERENAVHSDIESIHTVMNIEDDMLHVNIQLKNAADNNRIISAVKNVIEELQKTQSYSSLQYEKEGNNEMSVTIELLQE